MSTSEKAPQPTQPTQPTRAVSNDAVIAVMAMVGENCDRETALDIIETLRPHLEHAWALRVRQLEEKISQLQATAPNQGA